MCFLTKILKISLLNSKVLNITFFMRFSKFSDIMSLFSNRTLTRRKLFTVLFFWHKQQLMIMQV